MSAQKNLGHAVLVTDAALLWLTHTSKDDFFHWTSMKHSIIYNFLKLLIIKLSAFSCMSSVYPLLRVVSQVEYPSLIDLRGLLLDLVAQLLGALSRIR